MNRRAFLAGMAGILASGIAPAVLPSGIIMPVRKIETEIPPWLAGLEPGHWHLFQQSVRLGRAGEKGVHLVWVDGRLVADDRSLRVKLSAEQQASLAGADEFHVRKPFKVVGGDIVWYEEPMSAKSYIAYPWKLRRGQKS